MRCAWHWRPNARKSGLPADHRECHRLRDRQRTTVTDRSQTGIRGAERLLGWAAEEVHGKAVSDFLGPPLTITDTKWILKPQSPLSREQHTPIAGKHVRKTSSSVWASGRTVPMLHNNGEHHGFLTHHQRSHQPSSAQETLQTLNETLQTRVGERQRPESLAGAVDRHHPCRGVRWHDHCGQSSLDGCAREGGGRSGWHKFPSTWFTLRTAFEQRMRRKAWSMEPATLASRIDIATRMAPTGG